MHSLHIFLPLGGYTRAACTSPSSTSKNGSYAGPSKDRCGWWKWRPGEPCMYLLLAQHKQPKITPLNQLKNNKLMCIHDAVYIYRNTVYLQKKKKIVFQIFILKSVHYFMRRRKVVPGVSLFRTVFLWTLKSCLLGGLKNFWKQYRQLKNM